MSGFSRKFEEEEMRFRPDTGPPRDTTSEQLGMVVLEPPANVVAEEACKVSQLGRFGG